MHATEITWYKAIVLLTSAMGIGFGVTNLIYYNKIRVDNNCEEIDSGTATTLLWLNIILVVFSSILFFWSLFRLIFTGKIEKDNINATYKTHTHNYSEPLNPSESPKLESSYTVTGYDSEPEPL